MMEPSTSPLVLAEERRIRTAFLPLLLLAVGTPAAVAACLTGPADADEASTASRAELGESRAASAAIDAGAIDLFDGGPCALAPAPEPSTSDAGDCAEFKSAACGLPPAFQSIADGCYLSLSQCYSICHRLMRPCHAYGDSCVDNQIVQNRPVLVECAICPGNVGRRPEGFSGTPQLPDRRRGGFPPLGAFFAEVARLEAASIDAFERLRDELVAHGGPEELVRAADSARQDEVEHTRTMASLASRFGARPAPVSRGTRRPRALADVARENMVEGCIRETFGALVAAWQASHIPDPDIAATLERIARDELRHSGLSWAIARWSESSLSDEERAMVSAARENAIAELAEEAARPIHPELVELAGLPDEATQRRMVAELRATLWAA
jgi:hypothetical protein